jgi:ubiquinone/menaquinone biosynthesis C-methylase UbiE
LKNSNQQEQPLEPDAVSKKIAYTPKRSDKADESQRKSFDSRIVSYEALHYVSSRDFDRLVEIINPQDGEKILDAGAGYGAVTREILCRHSHQSFEFHLLDISAIQLERAIYELSEHFGYSRVDKMEFIQDSIVHPMCRDNYFDKVVAKMVIHEVPKNLQLSAFTEALRILKPGGTFIVWDVIPDAETQSFISKILRKKDQLAGFEYLAKHRYFPTSDEWINLFANSGFYTARKEQDILYKLETGQRLQVEFLGDKQRLNIWNAYIRELAKNTPTTVLEKLQLLDFGSNITLQLPKAIFSSVKP